MTSVASGLKGKTIAITGVSGGIGQALAAMLKADGCHIIGFDIQENAANVDQFIRLDLSDEDSITQAIAAIEKPLDGLCNNAGLPPRDGLAQKILQVNFLGMRRLTEAALAKLKDGASIVNMASRAGSAWRESLPQIRRLLDIKTDDALARFLAEENIDPIRAYNLSKEAVIIWTMLETGTLLKRDMRINSISPSAVATGILDDFARAFAAQMEKNMARIGRPAETIEIAHVAYFLLSDASSWIKGTDIPVDGGIGAFAFGEHIWPQSAK